MSHGTDDSQKPADAGALETVRVSVVLATHNRVDMLCEAIDSLLGQTRPIDEIIVVDDASTDTTRARLAEYSAPVRVIHRDTNQGKPAALNLAIPQAVGRYLWLFDDDDVALPDALASHLAFLDARADIDFTYSDKYRYAGQGNIWDRSAWQLDRMASVKPEAFLMRTMLSMNTLMQGMLIPKACLLDIGLFDASLDRCEDHDMLLRLSARYRGANLEQPTFVYREHAGVRGAGRHSHAAAARFRVLAEYRQRVFQKIRVDLPTSAYLMHRDGHPVASTEQGQAAAALIQRASIMLRHGLVREGLADLDSGLSHAAVNTVDDQWMCEVFAQTLDTQTWIFDSRLGLVLAILAVLDRRGYLPAAPAFMRGLYWHLRRSVADRQISESAWSVAMLTGIGAAWLARRATRRG